MTTSAELVPTTTAGNGVTRNAMSIASGSDCATVLADSGGGSEASQIYSTNASGAETFAGYDCVVNLSDLSLPALARLQWVYVYAHLDMDSAPHIQAVNLGLGAAYDATNGVTYSLYEDVISASTEPRGSFFDFYGVQRTAPIGLAGWDVATINAMVLWLQIVSVDSAPDPVTGGVYIAKASAIVGYASAPVVTVTNPSGTVAAAQPAVAWTVADADGAVQQSWHAKIFTAAQVAAGGFSPDGTTPIADSGEVYDQLTRGWQVNVALNDLTNYVAYVRTSKPWGGAGGTFYSAWASHAFTVDYPNSLAPTITRLLADYEQGRVYVEVTRAPSDPYPGTNARIESSLDGVFWQVCQHGGSVAYDGSGVARFYDYEVPAEDQMFYRAASVAFITAGWVTGGYSATSTVGTLWQKAFLRDPLNPAANMVVTIARPYPLTYREAQGVYEPLGRRTAVVMSDGARATKAKLGVWLLSREDVISFVALLAAYRTLRIDLPNGSWTYLRFLEQAGLDTLTLPPDLGSERPVRVSYKVDLEYIATDRPLALDLLTPS